MGRGPSKRMLLIDGDPATHAALCRLLGVHEPVAKASELSASVERLPALLEDLSVDSASQGPEGLSRVQEALSQHRPYLLAMVDWNLGGPVGSVETIERIWREDAALPILLAMPSGDDLAIDRCQVAERIGAIDRFLFVSRPLVAWEVRQSVAVQIDRRLARLERELELRSMERELHRLKEDCETASRAKRDFMANVSHEMRTPMNAILGFTRLLMKEPLRSSQAEKLRYVHNAATSLLSVMSNVLDLSRLSAGEVKLATAPFDLDAAIQSVLKTARPAAREKGLALQCQIAETVPFRLQGDETRFCQILTQLTDNAIKFTHSGTVHVQVSLDEQTPQTATLRATVTDTGVGIAPAQQAVIFDDFAQGDGSLTRQFGGMGLGLAITKRLVGLMGGELGFRSTPGQGSCFWVILTFAKQASCRARQKSSLHARSLPGTTGALTGGDPSSGACGGKPRVLVAENDRLNRTLAEMLLSRLGCLVDLAGTGCEVLDLLHNNVYDLVLLDVEMPEMNGMEVIRQIRRQERSTGRRVPIVVLTACALPGDSQQCPDAGGDQYLAKPFTPEAFVSTVRQYLPGYQDVLETLPASRATVHNQISGKLDASCTPEDCLQTARRALAEDDFPRVAKLSGALKELAQGAGSRVAADHAMRVQLAARSNNRQQAASALHKLEAVLKEEAVLAAETLSTNP